MDIPIFQEKLINTAIMQCSSLIIILLVLIILLLVDVIYKKKSKASNRQSLFGILTGNTRFASRFTIKERIGMKIGCAVIVLIVICSKMITAYNDINNNQYQKLENQSIINVSKDSNLFSAGRICVIDNDGKRLFFDLPYGFTNEDFPVGATGTIWFARESKVVLAFIPMDEE